MYSPYAGGAIPDLSSYYANAYEEYRWNLWSWWNFQMMYPSSMKTYEQEMASAQMMDHHEPEFTQQKELTYRASQGTRGSLKMNLSKNGKRETTASMKKKEKVTSKSDLKGVRQNPNPTTPETTLMLRNIPNKYCQRELLEDLETFGFVAGEHMDFFYLPIDPVTGANLGYAFVNLASTELMEKFKKDINQTQLPRHLTRKVVEVGQAAVQGFEENREYYARSSAMRNSDAARRPLFWNEEGKPINDEGEIQVNDEVDVTLDEETPDQGWVSTLMLRNLRNKFTQPNLLAELAALGFHPNENVDFFYLPIDTNTNANLGYAFVNFTSSEHVEQFKMLSGQKLSKIFKKNMVVVDEASVQGIQANWDLYARSAPINSSDPLRRPLFWPQTPLKGRSEAWDSNEARRSTARLSAVSGVSRPSRLSGHSGSSKDVTGEKKSSIRPPPGLEENEQQSKLVPPPGLDA